MAAPTPIVSVGGILILAPGGFMPPRLLLTPAGTHLRASVYPVAVASSAPGLGRRGAVRGVATDSEAAGIFVLTAATPGSGRRGATRFVMAAAGFEPANSDDDKVPFLDLIKVQSEIALDLLSELTPPAAPRTERYEDLKREVNNLVAQAGEGDKVHRAVSLVRAAYGIIRVAHWCYPNPALPPLPQEQKFVSLFLGTDPKEPVVPESIGELTPPLGLDLVAPELGEGDKVLIRGVIMAINAAATVARTARYLHGCGGRD